MTVRLAFTALVLALAACTAPAPSADAGRAGTSAVAARLSPAGLAAYHWDLASATDGGQQTIVVLLPNPDKPLRLAFADGALQVHNGCNRIGGRYRLEGATLRTGTLTQTLMACADRRLMDADAAIAARLEAAPTLQLEAGDPPKLVLRTRAGDTLTFNGVATPQTRFGSPGTLVFFEVAAQRMPCSHPLIPDMQCLQVRERHYDAQGLIVGTPGPWQPLYQEIEGFEHVPGQQNVLRVKRYDVANPPADAPAVAYVLDMVVESQVVD